MKNLAAVSLALVASIASAQPVGYDHVGTDSDNISMYVGGVKRQTLVKNPKVKLAEYTAWYSGTQRFYSYVVDCAKLDVLFTVELDQYGERYRSNPIIVPLGTVGFNANTYACSLAYSAGSV